MQTTSPMTDAETMELRMSATMSTFRISMKGRARRNFHFLVLCLKTSAPRIAPGAPSNRAQRSSVLSGIRHLPFSARRLSTPMRTKVIRFHMRNAIAKYFKSGISVGFLLNNVPNYSTESVVYQ